MKYALGSEASLVAEVLEKRGWQRTSDDDWNLFWGAHVPHQTPDLALSRWINHIGDGSALHHKGRFAQLVAACRARTTTPEARALWDFVPPAFSMPAERTALLQAAEMDPDALWIRKPAYASSGIRAALLGSARDAPEEEGWIIQRSIPQPHRIDKSTYVLRVYLAIVSLDPLLASICRSGIVIPSADPRPVDPSQPPPSTHTLRVLSLDEYASQLTGSSFEPLWQQIRRICALTLAASRENLLRSAHAVQASNARHFELLALDLIVDAEMHPWLIEVRQNPDLDSVSTPQDPEAAIKSRMLEDLVDLVTDPDPLRGHAGSFEQLFPHPEAHAWNPFWFPLDSDREAFARLGYTPPTRSAM